MSKAEIRKQISFLRGTLSAEQIMQAKQKIAMQIIEHEAFIKSKNIGIYIPHKKELDPRMIMQGALAKSFYAPCVFPNKQLVFTRVSANCNFTKNKYGILEPSYNPKEALNPSELDLVLVPSVAMDSNNNRIGYGSGYYDINFAFKKENNRLAPYLLALIYDFQLIGNIEPNEHDVKCDAHLIATTK
ncbi:MAG: 5-formyltetrahydrofolate cyclo-ligase [Legionellales bacterium]|jgi:5-formyltetrahydrofolate cyclo-ligase|nr:5-formyltetrahydrofolate cyclo-ligase [Legionellales bacterium]